MSQEQDKFYSRFPFADPSNQIRLLHIQPSQRPSPDATIQCELVVRSLSDAQQRYTAISYTWGAETPTKDVIINGVHRAVRWNCWYTLRQMRLRDTNVLYWIDSLCIDQSNDAEKAYQVRLMGFIYSQAGEVAVSLGESGDDQELFSASPPDAKLKHEYQHAMLKFADRPYINRLWVTQECMLAPKGRLEVFVGDCSVTWKTLREKIDIANIEIVSGLDLLKVYCFIVDADLWGTKGYAPDFWHCISRYRNKLCQDPRDKVYGLLGLVEQAESERITVDYQVSLLNLLLDVASIRPGVPESSRYEAISPGDFARMGINPAACGIDRTPIEALFSEFVPVCHEFRADISVLFRYHCLGAGGSPKHEIEMRHTSWASSCRCKPLGEMVDEWTNFLSWQRPVQFPRKEPCEIVFLCLLSGFSRFERKEFTKLTARSSAKMLLLEDPRVMDLVLRVCATYHRSTYESGWKGLWTEDEVAEVLQT